MESFVITTLDNGLSRIEMDARLGPEHVARITLHAHTAGLNYPLAQLQAMVCEATAAALQHKAQGLRQTAPNQQERDLRYG